MKTRLEEIPEFLRALEKVRKEVDTVISVGVSSKCLPDGSVPHEIWVEKAGYALSPTGRPTSAWAGLFSRRIEP